MKKGQKIMSVILNGEQVTVYDENGKTIKLTRQQRRVLNNYGKSDYLDRIKKEFSNNHVISNNFTVEDVGHCKLELEDFE